MQVDGYISKGYGLVVPTGTDLLALTGDPARAVQKLQPWTKNKTNVALTTIAVGELLVFLERQILAEGAGLIKQTVSFTEI